jgi:hypothetical protein
VARVGLRDRGQRAIGIELRGVDPDGDGERRDGAVEVDQAIEARAPRPRCLLPPRTRPAESSSSRANGPASPCGP